MKIDKTVMDLDFIKIYAANTLAFLSTFTNIDLFLKSCLILVSIVYTIAKTIVLIKNNHDKEEEENGKKH